MTSDDGPYESETAASEAGRFAGMDWCGENDVDFNCDGSGPAQDLS